MESDFGRDPVRRQLDEVRRGEVAPWVAYPPTPAWLAPAMGLGAAALALAVGLLDGAPRALAQLVLLAGAGLLLVWDRRRRGTSPTGLPPRELTATILRMGTGAVAVAALSWLAGEQVSVWLAAAVAAAGVVVVVARYDREYAAVAARLRAAES